MSKRNVSASGIVRRREVVRKAILRRKAGRPLVKIGIIIGKAAVNAAASVSKGCSVGVPSSGTVLIFSCVNRGARRCSIGNLGFLGIVVGDSTAVLSRIIMCANCVARGGTSLANSITVTGTDSLGGGTSTGTVGSLRKGVTNIRVAAGNNGPTRKVAIRVHKLSSLSKKIGPLVILSNVPARGLGLHSVGSNSVRSVRILGSTTSTSVCNTETSNNIVLVRAGGNRTNGAGVRCGNDISVGAMLGGPALVGTRRCNETTFRTRTCSREMCNASVSLPSTCGCA